MPDDYVKRSDVHKAFQPKYAPAINKTFAAMIDSVPAADVVKVVRCGQCKHCVEHYDTDGNAPYWTCKEWDSGTDYDGYCHYGERRDGGQDDG